MSDDRSERSTATPALRLVDSLNATCPWSGKPVSADGLTIYRGRTVGFCNPGCREKFDAALSLFDSLLGAHGAAPNESIR